MRQAQNDPSIKYIVTQGHRPPYSTGYHPGESQLAAILDGLGDVYSKYVLNLSGHSHNYERFQPIHGATHVTVGAPSSLETPWTSTDPRTDFRAMHLSHLRVDVGGTGLRLQAICDDSASKEDMTCVAGSVVDEYVIGTPPAIPTTGDLYVDKTSPGCSDAGAGERVRPLLHDRERRYAALTRRHPLHRQRDLRRDRQADRQRDIDRPRDDHGMARAGADHRSRHGERRLLQRPGLRHLVEPNLPRQHRRRDLCH